MQISAHVNKKGVKIYMLNDRLKEARIKLGLNQAEFGELVGAKKRTVVDWEKGVSSPTGIQLEKLTLQDVDVAYIVTGVESNPTPSSLPADEQLLIDAYRTLPVAKRKEMLASLLTGNTPKASKVKSRNINQRDNHGMQITGDNNIQTGGIKK